MGSLIKPLACAGLLAAACQDDPSLPPVLWEGAQVRFRSHEPLDGVCAGTLEHLDERAGHIDDRFGDPRDVVDYVWAPGSALGEYCELPTLGCGRGSTAFTVFTVDEHELFHALREPNAQRGLEEGLAVAFGDDRVLAGDVASGDIEAILRETGPHALPAGTDYPRLGHFVSYVHATHGLEALVELSRASDLSDGYDALAESVQATLGTSLDEVIADYEASYPICDSTHFRYDGFDCGRNVIAMPAEDGDEVERAIRVACDEPTALGPRAAEIWTMQTLDVPADGRHLVSVFAEEPQSSATIRLRRCDAACDELEAGLPSDGSYWMGLPLCLRRGAYSLRLGVPEGREATFRVRVRRMDHAACE